VSSFSQWRNTFVKDQKVRQITWVCGDERVLVDDVVKSIRSALKPEPWNYVPMVAGEDSEKMIWAEIEQQPLDEGSRLIVVRSAERLKSKDRIVKFIKGKASNPRVYVVFVSNEEKIPRNEPKSRDEKPEPVDYIAAFGTRGHVIECRPYTAATAKHAVGWVQSKIKIYDQEAAYLLNRANGDLRLVRDMCTKLALFPGTITKTTIEGMLSEKPRETFSDALIALDKRQALLALESLSVSEYSRAIGMLEMRLDLAGIIHDRQVERKQMADILKVAGNKAFLVREVIPYAKHYDSKRRLQIRKILSLADETLRSGQHTGVLELLVHLW